MLRRADVGLISSDRVVEVRPSVLCLPLLLLSALGGCGTDLDDDQTSSSVTPAAMSPTPTLELATPSSLPSTPTLEPITPTLEPITPTLEPITPTLEPITPTLEPITPTLEPVTLTPETATPTPLPPLDEDGDGFPAWYRSIDHPELADCDDEDPQINPLTERLIPEGSFIRGSDTTPSTSPVRAIWLSSYCIDVNPITNDDFAAFLNARAVSGEGETDEEGRPLFDFDDADDPIPERIVRDGEGGYGVLPGYERHPVTEVYQWSGFTYCEGRGQRLPTEAEWEKAARGDEDDRPYPWGYEEGSCDLANYATIVFDDTGHIISGDWCVGDTVPVASFPNGSPFGVIDMTSNVFEFVSDFYREDYYATSPDIDPQGPETGLATDPFHPEGFEAIVLRSGAWAANGPARTYDRVPEILEGNSNGVGFRCARSLEAP